MQDNLFADITTVNERISQYSVPPPRITLDEGRSFDSRTPTKESHQSKNSSTIGSPSPQGNSTTKPKNRETSQLNVSAPQQQYRISIDNVEKVTENTLLRNTFIVYEIRFTRLSDLEERAVRKRYKELYNLFVELSETYPQLEHNDQLSAFPTGGGFGAQKDPQSEFVQKRKAALELYFRALFGVYPALLKHPRIVEFFELDYLPPDISAAVSFGSKSVPVFELSGNTDHYRGRYADKDDVGVNGEGEGGTEQQRPQGSAGQGTQGNRGKAGWVRYDDICDRSVLAEVERTGLTYDIKSATLVRADEPVDNSAGTMTSIADILSYAPSYTVLPSVFARTLSPEPPVVSQGLGPNPEARSIRSDQ